MFTVVYIHPMYIMYFPFKFQSFSLKCRARLFEGRLALNPGIILTRVSFSFVQKHFLRLFSLLLLRGSNHQLVDKNN